MTMGVVAVRVVRVVRVVRMVRVVRVRRVGMAIVITEPPEPLQRCLPPVNFILDMQQLDPGVS